MDRTGETRMLVTLRHVVVVLGDDRLPGLQCKACGFVYVGRPEEDLRQIHRCYGASRTIHRTHSATFTVGGHVERKKTEH